MKVTFVVIGTLVQCILIVWLAICQATIAEQKTIMQETAEARDLAGKAFHSARANSVEIWNKMQSAQMRGAKFATPDDLPASFDMVRDGDSFPYLEVDGIPLRFDPYQRCYVHNRYSDDNHLARVTLTKTKTGWTVSKERNVDGKQWFLNEYGWAPAPEASRLRR